MNDDLILALYPRTSLTKDAKVPVSSPSRAASSIGHNVGSREEVDAVMEQARREGAHVVGFPFLYHSSRACLLLSHT